MDGIQPAQCPHCHAAIAETQTDRICPACLKDIGVAPVSGAGSGEATTELVDSEISYSRQIGPYKLLQLIGEGGMGVVYLAEQQTPIQRRVALKLIKPGMDSRRVIARFEAERQALAMMDHPNIAKVFDAGKTPDGRPYFVMEHVIGVAITAYCDSHQLSARERLLLFGPICSAVQHAHQKGIVHRDLKPSNVLVTLHDGQPVAKVIDFGVAKALHQRLTEKTLFTEQGFFIGTPEYMSPEQADLTGLDVDATTDIYSLGVLLYELLAGVLPFDPVRLREAGFAEIQRIIREEEPASPSTRLSGLATAAAVAKRRGTDIPTLTRQLRGDLDWIILKAMAKDRRRRYSSAAELSEDVRRHLVGFPIIAREDSAAYRTMKFVRRHRVGVAASTAIVISLAVGIAVSVHEARVAQRRFDQVRELATTFLFQFYDQVTPLPGSTAVRASIVDTARKYLDGLAQEAAGDRNLTMEVAQAYYRLGNVQGGNLGQLDDGRRSFRHALDLYATLPVTPVSPSDVRRKVADVWLAISALEFNAYHEPAAETATHHALDLLADPNPDPPTRMMRASAEVRLGDIQVRMGHATDAVSLIESADRALRDLQSSGFQDKSLNGEITYTRERLARARVSSGDLDGALEIYLDQIATNAPCSDDGPPSSACIGLAVRLERAGDVYAAPDRPNLSEPEKAVLLYEQMVHIAERYVATDAQNRGARFQLAARCGKLGDALWRTDPHRALDLYDRALATARTLASKEQLAILQDSYHVAISRPLMLLGRTAEARTALVQALEEGKTDASAPYPDQMGDLTIRGIYPSLLIAERKPAEARAYLETLIHDIEPLRASHPEDLTPVYFLSDAYRLLASISTGTDRRDAYLQSAAVWHSWPATSFTQREEQKDLAAAGR